MRAVAVLVSLGVPACASAASGKGLEGGSMTGAVFQMFASLALVIGIIYLLYYVSNRWFKGMPGGKAGSGLIRVVETRYMGPKRSLMIVEVAGEYLLLGNGSEGMQLIKKLDAGDEYDSCNLGSPPQTTPEAFLKKFDGLLGKSLTGLQAVINSDMAKRTVIQKRDGGRK
jgi:flagellar protein FliO/FliZ